MSRKLTKQDRIAMERLAYHTWLMELDDFDANMALYDLAPSAWHTLEADLDCVEKKEKVTLYLDRSVARTFKAMGKGYQARINRLLQTWLAMKTAKQMKVAESLWKHHEEMHARATQRRLAGEKINYTTRPGEMPPTDEPPEVDW